MNHRVHLLWIQLLAAVFAGPIGVPRPAWAPDSALGTIEASGSDVGLVRPSIRLQQVCRLPSPVNRHGGQPSPGLPATVTTTVVPLARETLPAAASGPFAETARHFPLFPIGPPSHG
jgi:hypothetical protein